jgi:hypothetical protein
MTKKNESATAEKKVQKKIIAKRDFVIHQNDVHIEIKEGDDINELNIPERFIVNLKTEKVI